MCAAIYTRNADRNSASHERQGEDCQKLAAESVFDITHDYHDEGRARFALERLMTDVREHRVLALVVASLERLGRTFESFTHVAEALNDAEVPLYLVGHRRVDVPMPPELSLMQAIADDEAEHIENITR